jgi:hypothetical protein
MINGKHETPSLKISSLHSFFIPSTSVSRPVRIDLANKAPFNDLKHQSCADKLSMENSNSAPHSLRGTRKISPSLAKVLATEAIPLQALRMLVTLRWFRWAPIRLLRGFSNRVHMTLGTSLSSESTVSSLERKRAW